MEKYVIYEYYFQHTYKPCSCIIVHSQFFMFSGTLLTSKGIDFSADLKNEKYHILVAVGDGELSYHAQVRQIFYWLLFNPFPYPLYGYNQYKAEYKFSLSNLSFRNVNKLLCTLSWCSFHSKFHLKLSSCYNVKLAVYIL